MWQLARVWLLCISQVTNGKPKSLFIYVIIELLWTNWAVPFEEAGEKLNFLMF